MFSLFRIFVAGGACLLLSACFLSEKPLIGEGAQIHNGPLAFCLDAGEPCHQTTFQEDAYLVLPHPEDGEEKPVAVRFRPLMKADADTIWLGEANLSEEGHEEAWAYVVARKLKDTDLGVREYEVAVPDCGSASDSDLIRYGLEKDGVYACRVTNIDAFAEYLRERHAADFASDAWWAEAR
ncbi:hypothetical protein HHI_07017 [Hyphomonas hirschiana VP5]|uniref:Lipoprotein n=1 Tax=Hyphomonas hirschiana VP5 TaxID=1280951 RepID=A0A059FWD9_9PROT|nr:MULTISPECIES: hypothetical protein [Hyphomonas]KCZ94979.1 hypothetical protein HHI_07017 [Hyphomonas hirschiana VP5]